MIYSWIPSLNVSDFLHTELDLHAVNKALASFAFLLVVVGFGTKVAFFPLNTWLPDAHGKAPSPVSAFMSSILLPLALYVIIRAKLVIDLVLPWFANKLLLIVALITLLFVAIMLLKQKHYKRALAYSSSEHMAIITIAFALNAPLLALAHLLFHSFIKAAAFMSAGNILIELWSGQFENIRELFSRMKYTPTLLILSLIWLIALPPSYLFFTEIVLIITAYQQHIWLAIVITLALLWAASGLFINFGEMFGKDDTDEKIDNKQYISRDDQHWNSIHWSIALCLLFPLLYIILASIWFWWVSLT